MMATRLYLRQQCACHLRLSERRMHARMKRWRGRRRRDVQIEAVMTGWLRRLLREQPVVVGAAHIEVAHQVPWTEAQDRGALRAWAYVYQHVEPRDAEVLAALVDDEQGALVRVERGA